FKHDRLIFRATDRFVRDLGRRPLSVSTDRIGVTAMRCARFLAELGDERGRRLDLTGEDRVVEVYPAAALSAWSEESGGLAPRRYKGLPGREARELLLAALTRAAPWFRPSPEVVAACRASDHAL